MDKPTDSYTLGTGELYLDAKPRKLSAGQLKLAAVGKQLRKNPAKPVAPLDTRTATERHRDKMAAKQARRATMAPGFQPMPNKRINAAIQAQAALLALQALATALAAGPMPSEREIQEQAVRDVARKLPASPIGKKGNPVHRATRSDDAEWRGVAGAGPVRQGVKATWRKRYPVSVDGVAL